MRILLIDDDRTAADGVTLLLSCEGIGTVWASGGAEGIALAQSGGYDLVILDLWLADMDGLNVLKIIRESNINTPVLVVSGDATVASRVMALRSGADDFLVKPFHRTEFMARIHAIVRRSQAHKFSTITTGELVLNLDDKSAEVSGTPLNLTVKEYMVLEALSLRKGATLSKEAVLHHLYDGRDEPKQKIIDVFVCKLRKKLEDATGDDDYIKTVWGQGYSLSDPYREPAIAA
jgi:two-component system cell cycle response regulator CtrA